MPKVKIDSALYDRAKKIAEAAGFSSVDELIIRAIEAELAKHEQTDDEDVERQLRGLGYIE